LTNCLKVDVKISVQRLHAVELPKRTPEKFAQLLRIVLNCVLLPHYWLFKQMNTGNSMDLVARIEEALQQLRPFLEADGGNVRLVEVTEDNQVKLELLGACRSCSMNMMTFKAGIEEAIRRAAPEVRAVEAINLQAVVPN
jgi:Fe-S cluster biogenesis protein NfuA